MLNYEKDQLYELIIDDQDEVSGIDSISLVDQPAIEVDFIFFSKDNDEFVIADGEDEEFLKLFEGKGESEKDLLNDDWIVYSIKPIDYDKFSSPNEPSYKDSDTIRVRYRYGLNPLITGEADIIPTSRPYCRSLISKNYVYRKEDIIQLPKNTGPGGGPGPVYRWRGGYNCRHVWQQITYVKKGKIYNNSDVNINKITDDGGRAIVTPPDWIQPSTATKNSNVNYKKEMSFKVFDEDKHIVMGPAMIPNYEMPRINDEGEQYFVYFSEKTIRMIAEKYMKNKFIDNNDVMHNGTPASDVYVVESWIKENEQDKSNNFGYDLPIGTWFVSMKVENDDVWKLVKSNKLKGFSVSGFFEPIEQKNDNDFLEELANILKKY